MMREIISVIKLEARRNAFIPLIKLDYNSYHQQKHRSYIIVIVHAIRAKQLRCVLCRQVACFIIVG